MTNVFVIESGSYSDRHIYGIFSTRELAEEHSKLVYESSGVQEWPLDTIKEKEDGCSSSVVCMKKDGSTDQIYDGYSSPVGFQEYRIDYETGERTVLCWVVDTPDVTKAVKIVNEKRIQILAMNLWSNEEGTQEYFGV